MPKSRAAAATGRPAVRTAWAKAVRSSDTGGVLQGMIGPPRGVDHRQKRQACPCTTCYPCPCAVHMRKVRRARGGEDLVAELVAHTGGWPRRVGSMLFARDRDGGIHWIKS